MISRKMNSPNITNSSMITDPAMQLALNYMRDFSAQASEYRIRKSEGTLSLVHRSASLLSTTIQPQYFNTAQLEVSKFFIDLHAVIGSLAVESNALWSCVALLQHCCRNRETRVAIVAEFRFVPLIACLLKRTQGNDKVLHLLQELTYGVQISWEEPYLIGLLQQLVEIIYSAEENETSGQLALSILINLCYKNFVVLFLLLRTLNISEFSQKIKNYGMLATKFFITLSEDMHTPNEQELHLFLRLTFAAIDDCIKDRRLAQLQQNVDFLVDNVAETPQCALHYAMLSYQYYCEDIERLLEQLDKCAANMNDSNEESRRQQQLTLAFIFQLIRHIFDLSALPGIAGNENIISLDSLVPRIFELLCKWLESDICGLDAVHLLDAMVRLAKNKSILQRIALDPSIVVQLVATSEKPETSATHTIVILQLLRTLLHQTKTEKLILSKISESYFDKIFSPLLANKAEVTTINGLAVTPETEKSIFCLLLLINFAGIAKKAYFEKCCILLQMPQIQHALARVLLSGKERGCSAVFEISQFEHFPQAQVAKQIAKFNACSVQRINMETQWQNLNEIFESHKTFVSKDVEARLQALIDHISKAHENNQLSNVATSQMIELYKYKIDSLKSTECIMQKSLDVASKEITHLKHRINLQNAELQKYSTMNFELHSKQESLHNLSNDLKQQKASLKQNLTNCMAKLDERTKSLQISEKRLTVKVSEMIALQTEHTSIRDQLQTKRQELEKLQSSFKENTVRIDKLKNSIAAFEIEVKEQKHTIDDRERELSRTQKASEEQREAKKKCDDIIAALETQLAEKNEEIRNYENELSETEELRKTILSLMESKKPKRK